MKYRRSKKPSVLLILAHPSEQPSLCRSLADMWEESLRQEGLDVERLDLAAAEQLGLKCADELQAAVRGKRSSTRVEELQCLVEENQFLVFVHPVFWFEVPSQLKGFLESVFSSGFAYHSLPSHRVVDMAAGVLAHLPVIRALIRRYVAYGLLRDKHVYVTRTHGGPAAGSGIFGHRATALEGTMLFCGARLAAVDSVENVHSKTPELLEAQVLPKVKKRIESHCRKIAFQAKRRRSVAEASSEP
jgi:NAD(P)H dehydrogenase (quinone)